MMARAGRELALAVLACAAGAGVALYAGSRTWLVPTVPRPAPIPDTSTPVTGAALSPALPALALVALAGAGALVATRGRGRVVVAAALALCGGALAVLAAYPLGAGAGEAAGPRVGWPVACVVAGVVVAASGLVALRRGHAWPGLGSPGSGSRFDRTSRRGGRRGPVHAPGPAGVGAPGQARVDVPDMSPVHLWDAIDHGEDLTKD